MIGNEIKLIKSLDLSKATLSHHLGFKQVWMRKDRAKCQVVFTALKARSSRKWYFDSGCFRHMTRDKSFLTSLKYYNGGTITFGHESLAHVKGKGSISIPSCPKLD